MAIAPLRRRFSLAEYHALGTGGVLAEDDRTELIEGEIWEMTPIGSRHAAAVNRWALLLSRAAADRLWVSVQNPLALDETTELQPDLALLRPRADFYAVAHPTADDAFLVIEIADTSLAHDRSVKAPLYARAGVRELWIIDLAGAAIEIHRDPSASGYRSIKRLLANDSRLQKLAPLADPEIHLDVAALFA